MSIWRSAWVVLVLQCLGTPDAGAQIVTDGSMGPATNLVGPDFTIGEGLGSRLGANLFHSFADFNVQQGQSATFTTNFAGATDNVISRVTGGNPSLIDGLLRSEIAGADFWFINPSGLVFGQNAVLDVPAGFYASTADVLELDDGGTFRATNPGASSLTVAPPSAFGFLDATVGSINVNGAQLSVGAGATLALVGGAQTLSSAMVAAPSGRVDLVAVASAGTVQATAAPSEVLGVSGFTDLATIELQSSRIDVDTAGSATAGSIGIVGQSIGILGGSLVTAGSLSTAADAGDAGQIAIQTVHETFIENSSILARSRTGRAGTIEIDSRFVTVLGGYVEAEATDNLSGTVNIETESLSVALEAGIRSGDVVNVTGGGSVTLFIGRIDAVELNFEVDSLSMDEGSAMGSTAAGVQAQFTLTGADGGIASDVSLRNESFIAAATTITTHDMTVGNEASIGATGAPIVLNVDRLFMTSGGSIGVGSLDGVDGGSVLIRGASADAAELVSIHGVGEFGGRSSIDTGAGVNPFIGDAGNGGDINIIARTLELSEDARITSNASSLGSGGNILLQVDSLTMSGGAVITSGTGAFGDAGDVTIRGATAPAAALVALDGGDGEDGTGIFTSSTFQDRGPGGPQGIAGAAGDIAITADEIRLTSTAFGIPLIDASTVEGPGGSISLGVGTLTVSGGFIQASTTGPGDAGSISIAGTDGGAADLIVLSFLPSEITTSSLPASSPFWTAEDAGDAGSIDIAAREIQVLGGASISSQTFGGGAGGSIGVQVDELMISGFVSRINVGTSGSGDAGNIAIDGIDGAPVSSIEVSGFSSGIVSSSSRIFGSPAELGAAGNISIRADSISLSDLAALDANTSGGSGGTIDIGVGTLSVTDGAAINAQTSAAGDAGEIVIHGVDGGRAGSVIVAGVSDNPNVGGLGARITSTSVASGPDAGAAGNIVISAETVAVSDGGFVRAETVDGQGGTISMDVGQLTVASDGLVSTSVLGDGTGGSIDIEADGLVLLEGGQITARSTDTGPTAGSAGNVSIAASELRLSLAEAGESAIDASTVDGAGGSIALAVGTLTMEDGSIQASTSGSGNGGSIDIDATDVLLEGGQIVVQSTAAGSTAGAAGDISITAAEVRLAAADGGTTAIDASTVDGAGGSIALAVDTLSIDGGAIQASTSGTGDGGSIAIEATGTVLLDSGLLLAESTGTGASGSVSIAADELQLQDGAAISVRSTGTGRAGSVVTDLGSLFMSGHSQIDATATSSLAGNVELNVSGIAFLQDSIISGLSADPENDGGNFIIEHPQALVLQRSSILANSASGTGGNISITADAIVLDTESTVEATGQVLQTGEVLGSVLQLDPPVVVDAAAALDTRCTSQQAGERSSMVVHATPAGAVREPYLPADASVAPASCRQ